MKVLALIEAPDHVCGRYRIAAFAPAMARAGASVEVEALQAGAVARVAQLRRASHYDAVILQRRLLPGWQLAVLRRAARRLIFDFDDAVLHRDSYHPRGITSPRRAARFGKTVRAADLVLAGNDFLADCAVISGARSERVRVIPTCVDVDRYRAIEPTPGAGAKLVWVGSSSTLRGLELRRDLWERLGREIPGLTMRVVADRFPRFDPLPVEAVPWDESTEVAAIAGGDIGISWVPDDPWSRGKCGLKVLQYMAAGLPVVANPVGVHPKIIDHGRTGYLAESAEEWAAAIRTLVADPALRRSMGRQARARVESDYSVSAWSDGFVAAVAGSGPIPPPRTRTGPPIARKADHR